MIYNFPQHTYLATGYTMALSPHILYSFTLCLNYPILLIPIANKYIRRCLFNKYTNSKHYYDVARNAFYSPLWTGYVFRCRRVQISYTPGNNHTQALWAI